MNFVDARTTLPRHPTRRWRARDVQAILGFVVHHAAGDSDVEATARYHIGPNHTDPNGMAGLAYTFFIDRDGVVTWANDLEAATWSQGGGGNVRPDVDGDGDADRDDGANDANGRFVGICLAGSFDGPHNPTGKEPTPEHLLALLALIGHLVGKYRAPDHPEALFGALPRVRMYDVWAHADFGKAACPGRTVTELLAALRRSRGRASRSALEWQQGLTRAGFDPGPIDGVWGTRSRAALIAWQTSRGLEAAGHRDDASARLLFGG